MSTFRRTSVRSWIGFAAVMAAAVPAQSPNPNLPVRICNLAPMAQTQWVDIAVPKVDGDALPQVCEVHPHGWVAIKGPDVGIHSTLFHVLAQMPAAPGPAGTMRAGTLRAVAGQPRVPGFVPSDWVVDDLHAVFPRPALRTPQGAVRRLVAEQFDLVEQSAVRRVWRHRGRLAQTPLKWESFLYIYTNQDAVRFECTVTNCDFSDPSMGYRIDHLWLESGEHLHLDYRTRLGLDEPGLSGSNSSPVTPGQWMQLLTRPRDIGRAESLFFSGHVLCLPSNGGVHQGYVYNVGTNPTTVTINQRIDSLVATLSGPVVGVSHDWEGHWLAFGNPPVIPHNRDPWAEANARHNQFNQLLRTPGDLYDNRPIGLNKHARTTGAQEDFGAAKGTMAIRVGDPRYLYQAPYSMSEFLRPFHNREHDGRYLLQSNHQGLQTWDQLINCRTTRDFLGLPCPLPYNWPSTGFAGIDDQHRSQNNFHALLALTGSHALKGALKDYLEIDLTQVPGWLGEPRAIGRLFMAWSSMYLLLDDPQDRANLRAHMMRKLATVQQGWLGAPFLQDPVRTVRAVDTGTDPTFHEPNGSLVNAIITWEHSIAVMGLYSAYKVTGDTGFRDLAKEVALTIARHCTFEEGGVWHCCTAIRYRTGTQEGTSLPSTSYRVSASGSDVLVNNGFWVWVFPAIQILDEIGVSGNMQTRVTAIKADVAPNGPLSWADAAWWASTPF